MEQETVDLKAHKSKRPTDSKTFPSQSQLTALAGTDSQYQPLFKFYEKNPELRVMHNLVKNLEVPKNDTFIKPRVLNLGRTLDMIELILSEFCEENA